MKRTLYFKRLDLKNGDSVDGEFHIEHDNAGKIESVQLNGERIDEQLKRISFAFLEMELQAALIADEEVCGHDRNMDRIDNEQIEDRLYGS